MVVSVIAFSSRFGSTMLGTIAWRVGCPTATAPPSTNAITSARGTDIAPLQTSAAARSELARPNTCVPKRITRRSSRSM